jgi:hypothetical protein
MKSLTIAVTLMVFSVELAFGNYEAAIPWFVAFCLSLVIGFGNQCTCK